MSHFKASELARVFNRDGKSASLINVLEEIQTKYRYLPKEALVLVSDRLGLPLSQVFSVATFYHAFSLKPRGEHTICVCTGTACHVLGAVLVLQSLESKLGIDPGETTRDRRFTLDTGNCLGACAAHVLSDRWSPLMASTRVK
jgi:NADH-quinone oxidoreductase subunit E